MKRLIFIAMVVLLSASIVMADDYYVNAGLGTDDPSYGGSPGSGAWRTITYALSQVTGSDVNPVTINVATGIYDPTLGEVFPLNMKDYVSLQGAGSDTTIIDAAGICCRRVITASVSGCVISGVTITGGNGLIGFTDIEMAVSNDNNSQNYFDGWVGWGGGIYGSPTINNCTITGNFAESGGGIYGSPEIDNSIISWNFGGGGGGINGSPTITNSIISGNEAIAGSMGGGILGSPTIINSIISNNRGVGGGIFGDPYVKNCTIIDNYGSDCFGGAICGGGTIIDSILWGNEPQQLGGGALVSYSCIQDGYAGAGNISDDPLFVTGPLGDYYLSHISAGQGINSPCIDVGSDTAENLGLYYRTTSTDEVNDSGIVDMGYHYPFDSDGDGISDDEDNCPSDVNPAQEDTDADEVGNICDNCPDDYNPDQDDEDDDTVGDICDNCPLADNPNQENSDNDSYGDSCDNCPATDNEDQLDEGDGDGVGDICDNCPTTPNPDQLDTYPPQGNNIGDACDCECDFTCNGNVDAGDVTMILWDFGRNEFNNPCTQSHQCFGDVDCNGACDADDCTMFLEDFGRNEFNNPCPPCQVGDWCVY